MEAIIQLENIRFRYGDIDAIRDVSLALPAGVFGLLGPNGAGKTTLMKLLLGFLQPASGSGTVMGHPLGEGQKSLRRLIGYMPESDGLIPGLDAVSLTAYLGELSGMPRQEAMKRAHDVLYYVGLEESRYRQVETYSTGMKQRLKLAQALVHDPKLLLLDEPTSGMDPAGRKEMLALIRDIAAQGSMNIILSSHLLPDIESSCSRVVIMNEGRIAAQGAIADLKQDRRNVYEIKAVGGTPGFFAALARGGWRVEERDQGLFHVMPPEGTGASTLFHAACEHNAQIRHFRQSRTSLEDAFMDVIRSTNGN